jgi:CheY-like chemotaxis protein
MKKILVVEDVDVNRDLVVQLLEDDYEVIEAVNGEEAIKVAVESRPDLILMDLSLPVIDGWEATRQIKSNDTLKSVPIIALTAHAMKGDEEKAKTAGCDDYMAKPIDENELFAKLAKYLS